MKHHRETRLKDKVKRDKFETKSRAQHRREKRQAEDSRWDPRNFQQFDDNIAFS